MKKDEMLPLTDPAPWGLDVGFPMLSQWCSDVQVLCSTCPVTILTVPYLNYYSCFLVEVCASILDSGESSPSMIVNFLYWEVSMFPLLEGLQKFQAVKLVWGSSTIPSQQNFQQCPLPACFLVPDPLSFILQRKKWVFVDLLSDCLWSAVCYLIVIRDVGSGCTGSGLKLCDHRRGS